MEWEFNKEFQDQIIYSMENQDETFVLDIRKGIIVPETQIDSGEIGRRFHRLPEWRSLEGYQLMERFIASIRNPIFREELRSALSSGTGVFRQFKNNLKKRKELEKLWFSFKEKEMTRVVFDWFNQIRELEGLERLNPPIEETDELISSDFYISGNIENHIQDILYLDRQVIMDAYQDIEESRLLEYYETLRESLPALTADGSLVAVAETPSGEFSGFVWGVHREDPPFEGTVVDLIQLAIMKE
ncbi:MAG TPA: hypothetical protein VMX75_02375, partial [Spirochaetia bacterium]|nr:hypothetical protein [Spirochaetia bacterium]